MTRHKGMSRKMVPTAGDMAKLDQLHARLRRVHEDLNPAIEWTRPLLAASATMTETRSAMAGEGDWLATTGAHKGALTSDDLAELEKIWIDLVDMAATFGIHSPAKHPLMVAALTVKAALAECSRLGSTWSCDPIYLRQALQGGREQSPEPKTYMFQGFGAKRAEPPKRILPG